MSDKIIKTSPRTLYAKLYVKGEGYIVYFKVMDCKTTKKPIAYISPYKFCGALNLDSDINIKLLEFCNDNIDRTPNAQIVRKSFADEHSSLTTFFSAVVAANSGGRNHLHLTNENREGIPVYAEYNPKLKSLKIFNVDIEILKRK